MAVSMFLKLEGISGEATDQKHAGEIELLTWNWGAQNTGDMHMGGGGGAGKVDIADIQLQKYVEKSSPMLMQFCCNGKHISEGVLTVCKSGGDNPIEYLVIKLTDVIITSVQVSGSEGDRLLETASISFAKFSMSYTPQKPDGTPDATVLTGWDVLENVPFS